MIFVDEGNTFNDSSDAGALWLEGVNKFSGDKKTKHRDVERTAQNMEDMLWDTFRCSPFCWPALRRQRKNVL